jgi:site-specific recombinase XerD
MATVNFYLDKPTSKTETQIYLYFSYSGKRPCFYTGQKILPKKWNPSKQRAKGIGNPFFMELNLLLDDMELAVKAEYIKLLRAKVDITKNKLFAPLKELVQKDKPNQKYNFITYMEFILKEMIQQKRSKHSIKGFKSRNKLISSWLKNKPHEFNDIDKRLVLDFKDFLIEKNFAANYSHKIIAHFKAVMNRAIEEEITNNRSWKSKRFNISEESIHNIYFNVDQLEHLFHFKFEEKNIELTRDSFLIDCFTGLRFSDGVELHKDKIIERDGVLMFTVNTKKTNERVHIPLHPIVKFTLDKYDGNLPPTVTNQTMNKNLKIMGNLAGFNEIVYKTKTKGGKRIETKHQMWELITTHTGRRSLATNLHLAGVPAKSAMLVTGHSTVDQYMDYIKITSEQNAKILSKSDFYKMKLKRV